MVDVAKYLCTPESELTDQLKFSIIKNRVPAKTDQDYIQSEIVADINNQIRGPYYGISADEVTDCSNWEQLGIVLRYVKDSVAVEKLIEYVKCHNINGNTITKLIIDTVTNGGLKNSLCRSQTYDGGGNMSGKQKGALNQFCEITGSKKQCIFIVHPMNSI